MIASVRTNDQTKVQARRRGRVKGVVASWRTRIEYTWRFWGGDPRERKRRIVTSNEVLTRFRGFSFRGSFQPTRTVDQSISHRH